eukprot:2668397-Karenia_brevis.AAC.1
MHRRRVWGTTNGRQSTGEAVFKTVGLEPQPNARLTLNTVHCTTLNRRRHHIPVSPGGWHRACPGDPCSG